MIEKIIEKWNEAIVNHFADVSKMVSGIATPVLQKDSEEVFFPAIISQSGDCEYPFADDTFVFGVYHRLLNIDYSKGQGKGYGDNNRIQAAADVLLICWGWTEFDSALNLERKLFSLAPETVSFISSNFDRKQVLSGEFSGIGFFLPPEVFLFSIKYRVPFTANKNCVQLN